MPHHERYGGTGYTAIKKGAEVIASDNKKIGEVADVEENFLQVSKGFLFTHDVFVPIDAIRGAGDNRVYLNVPSDRIEGMHWTEPPLRRTETGPRERFAEREGEMRVPIREEEFEVQKRMEQVGEVDITRRVTEEKKTMRVPRIHEEVTIERRRVDRPAEEPIREGETIRIPIREEEIHIEKRPVVREELVIRTRPVVEEEEVSGTIRREHVEVERHGKEERRKFPEEHEVTRPERREFAGEARPTAIGYRDIQRGWDVICSDNNKIGDVEDVAADYIHIKKGFLFTKDLYIPASAVDHVEKGRVYLNVTCERIDQMNWTEPPRRTRLGM